MKDTPWGQKRQDVWTQGNSFHAGKERRGFTGHEHLAYQAYGFELIHMTKCRSAEMERPGVRSGADKISVGGSVRGRLAASQTLNRYAYVGNNPVSFTDPSGHFIGVILGVVIGGLQAAISGGGWDDILKGAVMGGIAAGVVNTIGDKFGHSIGSFDFGNEFGLPVVAFQLRLSGYDGRIGQDALQCQAFSLRS